MYPDIVEQLVANHLDKGDSMSALITSEWYMRPKHFSGWGRPYEFTAGLYRQLGRLEESRDSVSHPVLLSFHCNAWPVMLLSQRGTQCWAIIVQGRLVNYRYIAPNCQLVHELGVSSVICSTQISTTSASNMQWFRQCIELKCKFKVIGYLHRARRQARGLSSCDDVGKGGTEAAMVEPEHRLCRCQADGWPPRRCSCCAESLEGADICSQWGSTARGYACQR